MEPIIYPGIELEPSHTIIVKLLHRLSFAAHGASGESILMAYLIRENELAECYEEGKEDVLNSSSAFFPCLH